MGELLVLHQLRRARGLQVLGDEAPLVVVAHQGPLHGDRIADEVAVEGPRRDREVGEAAPLLPAPGGGGGGGEGDPAVDEHVAPAGEADVHAAAARVLGLDRGPLALRGLLHGSGALLEAGAGGGEQVHAVVPEVRGAEEAAVLPPGDAAPDGEVRGRLPEGPGIDADGMEVLPVGGEGPAPRNDGGAREGGGLAPPAPEAAGAMGDPAEAPGGPEEDPPLPDGEFHLVPLHGEGAGGAGRLAVGDAHRVQVPVEEVADPAPADDVGEGAEGAPPRHHREGAQGLDVHGAIAGRVAADLVPLPGRGILPGGGGRRPRGGGGRRGGGRRPEERGEEQRAEMSRSHGGRIPPRRARAQGPRPSSAPCAPVVPGSRPGA